MFNKTNKLSTIIFEALQAQGTNIIIQNGIAAGQKQPHALINIIPRRKGDNLNFLRRPKQLNEEEMSTIELKLNEETQKVGEFEKEKEKPIEEKKTEEVDVNEKENYMIKQLERIP